MELKSFMQGAPINALRTTANLAMQQARPTFRISVHAP